MPIRSRHPKELLEAARLDEYLALREAVSQLLTELRTALFILRHMVGFPFDRLGLRASKQHVWAAFEATLLESVILHIRMLVLDRSSDSLCSLGAVVVEAIDPALHAELNDELVAVSFTPEAVEILGRINKLRNKRIAHFDLDFQAQLETVKLNSLDELFTIESALVAQFDLLCFGFGHATLPIGYLEELGSQPETDIEELLRLVASNSVLVNMPEEQPDYWNAMKDDPTFQATRSFVNESRAKLGRDPK